MQILIAPNAFKNSLPAQKVAEKIKQGLWQSSLPCECVLLPIGDGGDGTGDLLMQYFHCEKIVCEVFNPIGKKMDSYFGITPDRTTAIIELANASGLRLLQPSEYNPLHANTSGSGMLVKKAMQIGVKKIILCIGGSATVDGGTSILRELGIWFKDIHGNNIYDLPYGLLHLDRIDLTTLDPLLAETEIIIICDVTNPLLGANGAAAVFGAQKGATKEDIQLLETCLNQLATIVYKETRIQINDLPFSGAAGGVAAGLCAFSKAIAVNGIDYFLQLISFENAVKKADIIITGEGRLDRQTLLGKGPFGVAKLAKQYHKKIIAFAGEIADNLELEKHFDELVCINPENIPLQAAIANTAENLAGSAKELGERLFQNLYK